MAAVLAPPLGAALSAVDPRPVTPQTKQDRPLPPIPQDSKPSRSPSAYAARHTLSAVAAGKRKAIPAAQVRTSDMLQQVLENPRAFASLLSALSWSTFHTLVSTCSSFRRAVANPVAQNAILSRFVPGYQMCLGTRTSLAHQIEVTIEDLATFSESIRRRKPPYTS